MRDPRRQESRGDRGALHCLRRGAKDSLADRRGFHRLLRLASDWTAGFVLEPAGSGATRVTAQSVFKHKNPLLVLMMPMTRRKFHQTQRAILAGLKQFAETRRARGAVELETG